MYVCLGWVQGELSSKNLDSNLIFLHVNFHEDVLIKKYIYEHIFVWRLGFALNYTVQYSVLVAKALPICTFIDRTHYFYTILICKK